MPTVSTIFTTLLMSVAYLTAAVAVGGMAWAMVAWVIRQLRRAKDHLQAR